MNKSQDLRNSKTNHTTPHNPKKPKLKLIQIPKNQKSQNPKARNPKTSKRSKSQKPKLQKNCKSQSSQKPQSPKNVKFQNLKMSNIPKSRKPKNVETPKSQILKIPEYQYPKIQASKNSDIRSPQNPQMQKSQKSQKPKILSTAETETKAPIPSRGVDVAAAFWVKVWFEKPTLHVREKSWDRPQREVVREHRHRQVVDPRPSPLIHPLCYRLRLFSKLELDVRMSNTCSGIVEDWMWMRVRALCFLEWENNMYWRRPALPLRAKPFFLFSKRGNCKTKIISCSKNRTSPPTRAD